MQLIHNNVTYFFINRDFSNIGHNNRQTREVLRIPNYPDHFYNPILFTIMLSSLIKEHQARQASKRVVQEQKRKECIAAANDLTQALVDHLNVGVAQAYLNQKKLDAEAKLLHQGAINFAKQTQQWLALVENFSSALKEIGDVENWARSIENDMKIITDTLERAYEMTQEQPSNTSTSNQ